MKYRCLSNDELQELQPEFVRFLATQKIIAPDWEKMKTESPEKVQEQIELFSDIVFEKILKKIDYLEQRTRHDLRTFHIQDEKINMLGIKVEGDSNIDFTQNVDADQMLQQLHSSSAHLQLYAGERVHRKERTIEVFGLMQEGALISKDGAMYKTLDGLKKAQ